MSESSSTSRRSIWQGGSLQDVRPVAGCVLLTCRHAVTTAMLLCWQRTATSLPRATELTLHSLALTEELAISLILIKQITELCWFS